MNRKKNSKHENLIFEELRRGLNITQAEFAKLIGTTRTHYWTRLRYGTKIDGAYLLNAYEVSKLNPEEFGIRLVKCLFEERKLTRNRNKA